MENHANGSHKHQHTILGLSAEFLMVSNKLPCGVAAAGPGTTLRNYGPRSVACRLAGRASCGDQPDLGVTSTSATNCETLWKCLTHSERHTAHRWMSDSHQPQRCWEEEGHMANTVRDPEAAAAKVGLCSTHRQESLSANPGRDAQFPWQGPPCAPCSSRT